MNNKIRLGILGGGGDSLIGVLHRVASSMFDRYEIIGGVFNPNYPDNVAFAKNSPIGVDTMDDFVAIKKIMEYKS